MSGHLSEMIVLLDTAAVEIVDEFFAKYKKITREQFVKAVRDSFNEVRNHYYVEPTIWGRSLEQRDHKGGSWFSELVEIALAEKLSQLTGGDSRPGKNGNTEPDVVCIFSEWYNIEIKVSSTQYEVPGHAYNKNTGKTKNMDAYYLVTNYLLKENQIRVRFGWLLKSDWPHSDSHGKSDVRRDVQNRNLVELHNENREYWKH